jgi:hypothetical protein
VVAAVPATRVSGREQPAAVCAGALLERQPRATCARPRHPAGVVQRAVERRILSGEQDPAARLPADATAPEGADPVAPLAGPLGSRSACHGDVHGRDRAGQSRAVSAGQAESMSLALLQVCAASCTIISVPPRVLHAATGRGAGTTHRSLLLRSSAAEAAMTVASRARVAATLYACRGAAVCVSARPRRRRALANPAR